GNSETLRDTVEQEVTTSAVALTTASASKARGPRDIIVHRRWSCCSSDISYLRKAAKRQSTERGCVADQPQHVEMITVVKFSILSSLFTRCGWSSTQPRSSAVAILLCIVPVQRSRDPCTGARWVGKRFACCRTRTGISNGFFSGLTECCQSSDVILTRTENSVTIHRSIGSHWPCSARCSDGLFGALMEVGGATTQMVPKKICGATNILLA
ncbi:MAG: hypothetical protein JWM68_4508, partial [Verrucomicrobiales bacterium]|nr:hypothetical protein [Verrucomicrobiales bacterium]